MDISELREKPAGRQPIDTRAVADSRTSEIIDAVGRAIDGGKLVYRSDEHTSELQSLMRISYAVFCLKKKQTRKLPITPRHDINASTDWTRTITTYCR